MVGSIDILGAGSSAVPYRASVASAQSQSAQQTSFSSAVSNANATASGVSTATASSVATTDVSTNPRTISDPSAGFITQFLSANGSQVVYQYPSVITVAYLRQGLTADGTAKTPPYQPVGTTV